MKTSSCNILLWQAESPTRLKVWHFNSTLLPFSSSKYKLSVGLQNCSKFKIKTLCCFTKLMQHQNANYAWICQTEQHSTSSPLPRKDIWKWKRSKCEAKLPLLRQSFASPQGSTPHRSGRPLRINLMSRYICFSQIGLFDVSFEELFSKVQNPGGFFRKIVF